MIIIWNQGKSFQFVHGLWEANTENKFGKLSLDTTSWNYTWSDVLLPLVSDKMLEEEW